MKRRMRWYQLTTTDDSLSALPRRMVQDEYNVKKGKGFIIDEASARGHTRGTFVERYTQTERIVDAYGVVTEVEREMYNRVAFHIAPSDSMIEVIDPPRSCRAFISRLGSLMDYRLAVEQVQPKVDRWMKAIEKSLDRRVVVTAMTIVDVPLTAALSADVQVQGAEDVRAETKRLLATRRGTLVSAAITWTDKGRPYSCELSQSGASCPAEFFGDLAPMLYRSVKAAT